MSFQEKNIETGLLEQFNNTRKYSLFLCEGLSDEDLQAQSMPDASPLKWHLAHTTWAFETFVLKAYGKEYLAFDATYEYLFNSYYNAIGAQFPRAQRGLLTRPSRQTIIEYREYVDQSMQRFISEVLTEIKSQTADCEYSNLIYLINLTINHEQQHQELMLTDLKHLLSINPVFPAYADIEKYKPSEPLRQIEFAAGLYTIGHNDESFYFDNEAPKHDYYLPSFKLDSRLVSNADYLEFVDSAGYDTACFWLSEAWQKIAQNNTRQPLYWIKKHQQWFEFTLNGLQPLNLSEPVKHLNYFEANAYANWKGKRLPTEQEWEIAARSNHSGLQQMFGQVWQWTSSSYNPYPGFKPMSGAVGEYNGKFMVNQYVLKGGSIVTPDGHIRPSYRNFFYPDANWQFSGIRLAE